MKNFILQSLMMLSLIVSEVYANTKHLEVSFGVNSTQTFYDENKTESFNFDNGPLGFDCEFENEIILKFGDLIYKYDENEKNCETSSRKSTDILTWYSSINNLYAGDFNVDVTEVDIASNDHYDGHVIRLTNDDIKNIKNGNYVQKDIGSNYFIGFKEILLDSNIVIHDFSEEGIATFEAFYKESSSIGWITTAVFAVIATAVIVYSGGTAAPALATIAANTPGLAAIGSLFGGSGLVGAAATSSGLAFLGAGSMAAGIVVVGSALSFGTGIAIDYATTKALDEYSYSSFAKNSKNMMTLPLPKNNSGCDSYENAMSILEDVDSEAPLSAESSQVIIKKAIEALKVDDENVELDEKAKKESLSALLYFISNNYIDAKRHAELSISLANKSKVKHTLPSYIVATSSLYEETFDYTTLADKYLRYSFLQEVDNPIIPLLLSVHMDRMMYRFSDGMITEKSLNKVFEIVSNDKLKNLRLQNYIIVLSRYFISLKLEQQKISSLAVTENKTIKNSPKTLLSIKKSFESYDKLIIGANNIVVALEEIEVEDETEVEAKKQVNTFKELIVQYSNDRTRLAGLIQDLETYQASLSADEIVQVKVVTDTKDKNMYIGLGIVFIALIGFLMTRRKEEV